MERSRVCFYFPTDVCIPVTDFLVFSCTDSVQTEPVVVVVVARDKSRRRNSSEREVLSGWLLKRLLLLVAFFS